MTHPRSRALALALAATGALTVPAAAGGRHHGARAPLTVAVIGDTPYGTSPTDTSELDASPAFIAAINADAAVAYTVHVGDIHSGKQYCTEAYDRAIYDLWTRFARPLVYTPGDNEWTDCHKKGEGGGAWNAATGQIDFVLDGAGDPVDHAGGDPIANLDLVRQIFFARPGRALGGGAKAMASQAWFYDRRHPDDRDFVENVIWEERGVVFVTIDLPGGSNNDQDVWYGAPTESAAQAAERAARTGADQRWLATAFAFARAIDARGVVIAAQADMWDPEKGAAHQAGYEPIVRAIADGATAFGGPVLMFNGDSHVYRSDAPLSAADPLAYMHPGYDVRNVHRVVVHGSTMPLEYLRLTIAGGGERGDGDGDDDDGDGDGSDDAPPAGAETFGPFAWQRVVP